MSLTVFLGNLPTWVTADDIKGWLTAESLVADAIKVIRNPETQESKGFAFIEAPNMEEMNAIIRRFDRAPLEDRLLRANPAQPPKPKGQGPGFGGPAQGGGPSFGHGHGGQGHPQSGPPAGGAPPANRGNAVASAPPASDQRVPRKTHKGSGGMKRSGPNANPQSAFAEELAKVL